LGVFLAGKTLDIADQWSSVAAGFAALLLGLPSLVIAVLALRSAAAPPSPVLPGPADAAPRVGPRGVNVGGSVSAPIITGDNNTITVYRDGKPVFTCNRSRPSQRYPPTRARRHC
jgi:hypothetical protein